MSLVTKNSLVRVKTNAIKLSVNKQIPVFLASMINKLTLETPKNVVLYLMSQSEHMMRLKGYYKKYPDVEKDFTEVLKKDLRAMGYYLD